MRIEKIYMSNFRQYRNMTFEFPKEGNNDMHILVATNGTGKTTLLNAINWCLYGDEPHTSGKKNKQKQEANALSIANINAREECKENGDDYCIVIVEIVTDDNGIKYKFTRSAKFVADKQGKQIGKDNFQVVVINPNVDSSTQPLKSEEEAKDIVSKMAPKKIRQYFFFDGEQLLNYFGEENTEVSHIRDCVYEIAQVNVIKEAANRLEKIEQNYRSAIKKLSPNLGSITNELEDIKRNIIETKEEITKLEYENTQAETAIQEADNLINGTEQIVKDNELFENNVKEISNLQVELKDAKKQLSAFIKKYMILLSLYDINKKTSEYIDERVGQSSDIDVIDIDVFKKSLEKRKCVMCGSDLNEEVQKYFNALINKYNSNVSLQKLLEIKNDIKRSLNIEGYHIEKAVAFEKINKLENRIKELETKNSVLYIRISTVSGIKDIEIALGKREKNRYLKDNNLEKIGKYKERLNQLIKGKEKKNNELQIALNVNKQCEEISQKLKFVSNAKEIIDSIKTDITNKIARQLEERTFEYFNDLLWKKNSFSRVSLDETFALKLYHAHDEQPCLDSISAAETELLALAFTLAIHKVSGYDNMLFIDTPVGRVSDTNRENVAQVLLDVSRGKQIILAFTPSEYSNEVRKILSAEIVASYSELTTDELETRKGY